jgi:predicted RecA/RadA family phage recombinase
LIGDGVLIGDAILTAFTAMVNGDAGESMEIVPDDGLDYLGY